MDVNERMIREMWQVEAGLFVMNNYGLHSALRKFADSKNPEVWQKVHDMVKLLKENGLKLYTSNIAGDTIEDYISLYNWESVLADLMDPYTGFEKNYDTWRYGSYTEHHEKVHQLLLELKEYEHSRDVAAIKKATQKIVNVFNTIPRDVLKTFYQNLYNATCMYGFLNIPEVDAFFKDN